MPLVMSRIQCKGLSAMSNYVWDFYDALRLSHTDLNSGIAQMKQARQQAELAGDNYTVLQINHWILQRTILGLGNVKEAYDLAIATATEVQKPEYANHENRACVFQDLILVHEAMDPIGYEDLIIQSLDYMESQLVNRHNCRMCFMNLKTSVELAHHRLDTASEWANRALAATNSKHYRAIAMGDLCEVAFLREDWETLHQQALMARELAKDEELISYECEAIAALAIAAKKLNRDSHSTYYRQAAKKAASTDDVMTSSYYNMMCMYQEMDGNLSESLKLRERQIADYEGKGKYYWEIGARLEKLKLLKQLEQPFEEDAASIGALIPNLKASDHMTATLESILNSG